MKNISAKAQRLAYQRILSTTYDLSKAGNPDHYFSVPCITKAIPLQYRNASKTPYGKLDAEKIQQGLEHLVGQGLVDRVVLILRAFDAERFSGPTQGYRTNPDQEFKIAEFLNKTPSEESLEVV